MTNNKQHTQNPQKIFWKLKMTAPVFRVKNPLNTKNILSKIPNTIRTITLSLTEPNHYHKFNLNADLKSEGQIFYHATSTITLNLYLLMQMLD